MARVIPQQFIDVATGRLTLEATLYLNDLENGEEADSPGINTVLAGVNAVSATTNAIIAGTQPLADVLITGVGSVSTQIEVISGNIETVNGAASSGALTASADTWAEASSATPATLTTNAVTITAQGGTGPYTYAWTKVVGDTFTVTSPTAAVTQFQYTFTAEGVAIATYRCTVTDAALATYVVDVSVYAQVTG